MKNYRYNDSRSNGGVIVILIVFAFMMLMILARLSGMFTFVYSEGERVGVVNKLSHKGIFCKTWEGEMNLGGFRNSSSTDANGNTSTSVVANLFEFTVSDPEIVDQVQQAMRDGRVIALQYEELAMSSPCAGSTSYFIVGVK